MKAVLHVIRCSISESGIVLDNEAQLADELTGMIDRAINEDS